MLSKLGWVEQDPLEIWDVTRKVMKRLYITQSYFPSDLAAIGLANQRETTTFWHKRQDNQ